MIDSIGSGFEKRGAGKELVVLLHAYSSSPEKLCYVRSAVAVSMPDADIMVPKLPAGFFSKADPIGIVENLLKDIDRNWQDRRHQSIILIGHSVGALLARKVYVCACGENPEAPFEEGITRKEPYEWANRVDRIVLLAATNRGWSFSPHLSLYWTVVMGLAILFSNLVMLLGGQAFLNQFLIFKMRRGANFITALRIQWLFMKRHATRKSVGNALIIQLLGSIDDVVSPEDNIDLMTGKDFIYIDVPASGHANVIKMDPTHEGMKRREKFIIALTSKGDRLQELKNEAVIPVDLPPPEPREDVTDVIFVIHGIRDEGFWTHKLARRIKKAFEMEKSRFCEIETSSYGYFGMLPFLLPWRRQAKVDWLMDQYTENLSLYPKAEFSFVGHSNGTYLVAKALKDYPYCRFKHVVFAGSVVRTDYKWRDFLKREGVGNGRVKAVLNYVATRDCVVAFFPKVLQIFGQDLGSAGHDGFELLPEEYQTRYIKGGHSAARIEENWDKIASFIVTGKMPKYEQDETIFTPDRSLIDKLIVWPGNAVFTWIVILSGILWIGFWVSSWELAQWQQKGLLILIYLWTLWKVTTRL